MSVNKQRTEWAESVLLSFSEEAGIIDEGFENQMNDLLCSLMHLAEKNDFELGDFLLGAEATFKNDVLQDSGDRLNE